MPITVLEFQPAPEPRTVDYYRHTMTREYGQVWHYTACMDCCVAHRDGQVQYRNGQPILRWGYRISEGGCTGRFSAPNVERIDRWEVRHTAYHERREQEQRERDHHARIIEWLAAERRWLMQAERIWLEQLL